MKFEVSLLFCLTAQAGDLSLDELCLCRNLQPTVLPNGACLLLVVQDKALSYDSGTCHRCCTRPNHPVRKRNQARQVGWVCPYFQGLLQAVYKGIGFGFLCNWMAVLRTEHACIRQEILRAVTNAKLCQKTQLVCCQNEIQTSSYWDWLHPKRFGNQFNEKVHMPRSEIDLINKSRERKNMYANVVVNKLFQNVQQNCHPNFYSLQNAQSTSLMHVKTSVVTPQTPPCRWLSAPIMAFDGKSSKSYPTKLIQFQTQLK